MDDFVERVWSCIQRVVPARSTDPSSPLSAPSADGGGGCRRRHGSSSVTASARRDGGYLRRNLSKDAIWTIQRTHSTDSSAAYHHRPFASSKTAAHYSHYPSALASAGERLASGGMMKRHSSAALSPSDERLSRGPPAADELEAAFRDLLDELDLSPEKERELNAQSAQKKWRMIVEQNQRSNGVGGSGTTCEEAVRQLDEMARHFPDNYALPLAIQRVEGLAISLRTHSFSFVQRFIRLGGVMALVDVLWAARRHRMDSLALPVLAGLRALLNSSVGRNCVLESEETLLAVASALDFHSHKCKILSLEILSGMCLAADGGHAAVLRALTDASAPLGERTRFQRLVDDLHRDYDTVPVGSVATVTTRTTTRGSGRETERVRIAIMSLINALLKSGPAEQSLEFRLHLRYEFLMLGLQAVIERLRSEQAVGSTLADHFDLFEMMRHEDEQELSSNVDSGAASPIDFESPAGMAEALTHRLDNTLALPHLISLLQHLLMIPGDEPHLHLWRLFDMILQQLSLRAAMAAAAAAASAAAATSEASTTISGASSDSGMPESDDARSPPPTGKRHHHHQYSHRRKFTVPTAPELPDTARFLGCALNFGGGSAPDAATGSAIDLDELISRLRTHNDCERLERQLADVNAELDAERRRALELENRCSDLQDGLSLASFSRTLPETANPCHSPVAVTTTPPPLPPVRPPTAMAPPPPPPTALQLRSGGGLPLSSAPPPKQKNVPKPPAPLRTLNWTPLPAHRCASGTVWEKMEDEKLYKQINLKELASTFAAAGSAAMAHDGETPSVSGCDGASSSATLARRTLGRHGVDTTVTVIDARRAQNCTIMLSKLKLSHREIRATVYGMDERGKLPKDMIEQMMKFVPAKEEVAALRDAVQRHKTPTVLALADRFLYEMSQIPRYEQRLKCLYTIRTFHERLDELKPYMNAVIRASTTLTGNKKLKQFLALILAVGNYLNYGKRNGNAQGFSIASLSAIQGVKSAHRHDRNLMHFLVELVEKKFPDLLRLKRELSTVYEASRFNRDEMEAEFRSVEHSLREVAAELLAAEQRKTAAAITAEAEPSPASEACAADQPLSDGVKTVLTLNGDSALRATKSLKSGGSAEDRFTHVVRAFLETARMALRDVQMMRREMDEKFLACTKFYGEEPPTLSNPTAHTNSGGGGLPSPTTLVATGKRCSPDEFFGAFAKCFNQFAECYQAIWEEREEAERSKRQTLVRSIFAKKATPKQRKQQQQQQQQHQHQLGADGGGGGTKKDFESLVNALQSGELFSEDLTRLRHSIRIHHGHHQPSQQSSGGARRSHRNSRSDAAAAVASEPPVISSGSGGTTRISINCNQGGGTTPNTMLIAA